MSQQVREVMTTQGLARVHISLAHLASAATRGTLLLGHGAGGGVLSRDLQALIVLADHGWNVVLIEQPWRVCGRRIAVAPPKLDEATSQVLDVLGTDGQLPRPWVLGGRSAGARVACRLSRYAQACVLVSFPLVPTRRDGSTGESRSAELMIPLGVGLPTLVVQGERDRFGGPQAIRAAAPGARVTSYLGDHNAPRETGALVADVSDFLDALT